jgi:hypothetical protein
MMSDTSNWHINRQETVLSMLIINRRKVRFIRAQLGYLLCKPLKSLAQEVGIPEETENYKIIESTPLQNHS